MSRSSTLLVMAAALLGWGCAGSTSGHNELLRIVDGIEGDGEVGSWVYSRGFRRRYTLALPSAFEEGRSYPLLIMLHGVDDTGAILRNWTGMDTLAAAADYVVAFPTGLDRRWNVGCEGCQHQESLIANDVLFVETMVRQLAGSLPVDTTRVFVAGHSLGGQFAQYYACTAGLTPAGVASVGGAILRRTAVRCDPERPYPVLLIHGDRDPVLRWNGPSNGVGYLSAAEAQAGWAQILGCAFPPQYSETPDTAGDGTRVTTTDFPNCEGGSRFRMHRVRGGGHGWPGAPRRVEGWGRASANLHASQAILDFFEPYAHPARSEAIAAPRGAGASADPGR